MKKILTFSCSQLLVIVSRPSAAFIPRAVKSQITPHPLLLLHITPPPPEPSPTTGDKTWSPTDAETARKQLNIWPLDEQNIKLLDQVHPKTWPARPHSTTDVPVIYDLVAIGAGAGGLVSSRQSARRGATAAMISARLAGGDCLNVGCVPSKALIQSARMVCEVRRALQGEDEEDDTGVRLRGEDGGG
mmetsp:Transcript_10354/g.12775  ORF Transcript_10354/g.12775 Transcript_10354/m.12775 type:complete len:188 (-) Transcript_10354:95-658(-)